MDFPELIELFAKYPVAEIGTVPEYMKLCDSYVKPKSGWFQFGIQRERTEGAKQYLERVLDTQPSYRDQVAVALRELKRNRYDRDGFELYLALIDAGYKKRWSEAQRKHFDSAVPSLRNGYDFFLSFTSRSPVGPLGVKIVNQRYWGYITNGPAEIPASDWREKNLLAEVFMSELGTESLDGFYYPHRKDDNANVEVKLEEAVRNSRVFVQLVEPVMFKPPKDRTNYCEYEYSKAKKLLANDARILFVLLADPSDLMDVHKPYESWATDIRVKDPPQLPRTDDDPSRLGERLVEIRKKVEHVVNDVKNAWNRILDTIPY
jgi:hypothetical protein